MKRFKNYLKEKLRNWLEINTIDQNLNLLEQKTNNHNKIINTNIFDINNRIDFTNKILQDKFSHFQDSVNTLHRTVKNAIHIGTDVRVNEREHSWAVVCIEGKMNLVKFVDLGRNDARYVLDFLKQFDAGRHCIDAPYKEMFYDGLFKF